MSAPDEGGALFQPELQYVAMGEALMWSIECKFGASFTPEPARPGIGLVLSHMVWKSLSSIRQSIFRQHE